jgi:hypothetical protein
MAEDIPIVPPGEEHRWLAQLVGDWTYAGRSLPDDPACNASGTETVRMLGDLWMLAESVGQMAGGHPARSLITVGFDPDKGRFVGSFIGSMMASFWTYDGALDPDGRALRLRSEGPRFDGSPGTALYEDVIEIIGPDERLLRGRVRGDGGVWSDFMVTRYRRQG